MPDPFITTADLTDLLGRDVTADDGAVIAIDYACDVVRDLTGQTFNAGTATVTLDGTGTDCILLPQRPVSSVTSVSLAGSAITDYVATPDGRLLRRGTVTDTTTSYAWPSGRQNVSVTYVHGYAAADLPRSVKGIALSIAARMVVQGVASREVVGDVRVDYATPVGEVTPTERLILNRYRNSRSM